MTVRPATLRLAVRSPPPFASTVKRAADDPLPLSASGRTHGAPADALHRQSGCVETVTSSAPPRLSTVSGASATSNRHGVSRCVKVTCTSLTRIDPCRARGCGFS